MESEQQSLERRLKQQLKESEEDSKWLQEEESNLVRQTCKFCSIFKPSSNFLPEGRKVNIELYIKILDLYETSHQEESSCEIGEK